MFSKRRVNVFHGQKMFTNGIGKKITSTALLWKLAFMVMQLSYGG